jgi:hypothetical protein
MSPLWSPQHESRTVRDTQVRRRPCTGWCMQTSRCVCCDAYSPSAVHLCGTYLLHECVGRLAARLRTAAVRHGGTDGRGRSSRGSCSGKRRVHQRPQCHASLLHGVGIHGCLRIRLAAVCPTAWPRNGATSKGKNKCLRQRERGQAAAALRGTQADASRQRRTNDPIGHNDGPRWSTHDTLYKLEGSRRWDGDWRRVGVRLAQALQGTLSSQRG